MIWDILRGKHRPVSDQYRDQLEVHFSSIEQRLLRLEVVDDNDQLQNLTMRLSRSFSELIPGMKLRLSSLEGFAAGTTVECVTDRPVRMRRHRHTQMEYIFLLSGQMEDALTGRRIGPGQAMTWRPKDFHQPYFLTPSHALLVWVPPLENITPE